MQLFGGRDFDAASEGVRDLCAKLGFTLLERETLVHTTTDGRDIRFVGTTRFIDFDLFGPKGRHRNFKRHQPWVQGQAEAPGQVC